MRKRTSGVDVSADHKRAEAEYRTIIQTSMDGFWLIDIHGNILDVNDAYCRLIGYNRDELLKMNIQDVEAAETYEEILRHIKEVKETGHDRFESYHRHKNGKLVHLEISSNYMETGDGRFFVFLRDITERKKVEEALQKARQELEEKVEERSAELSKANEELTAKITAHESVQKELQISEAKFRHIFDTMSSGVAVYEAVSNGEDFIIRDINKGAEKIEKISRGDIIGKSVLTIFPGVKEFGLFEVFQRVWETGNPEYFPVRLYKDQRISGWKENYVYKLPSGEVVAIYDDVTERKKAEEALRASEAALHDNYFAQSAINMILSESLEDVPLEVILQKALNMILSIPWIAFESLGNICLVEDEPGILVLKAQNCLPEVLIKLCSQLPFGKCLCGRAALTQGIEFADCIDERHEICYEGMTPHGHYTVPILFGGKTLGVLNIYLKEGHIRDKREEEFLLAVADTLAGIIVRKKIEAEKEKLHYQLLQAQKMEAVGELAGGVAHDFNNILTAIISYGSLLKMKLKEDDPLSGYAEHILSSSERAANLINSLLAFSRKQTMNARPVDMNQVIGKVEKLLVRIISEDIELKTVLTERDLTIMADPIQMEQVLMNLATNARDAMQRGGTLEIKTKTVDLDKTFIRTHGYGKKGGYALISVSDTGTGMDERTRDKIFEPFFTTKEVGKGTGLGLSMVYGIIKQHGGYINVYSEAGKGTTFNIYLPLIRTKAEDAQPEGADIIKRGVETILLADDNPEVRTGAKAILEEFGYKIIEAADGEDAVVKFNRYKDRIKLVILDVIMPKKNGKEAYKEIRKISPDVKVIFISGYTADIIQQKGILYEGSGFIHKPISPQVLLRKVREILDSDKE